MPGGGSAAFGCMDPCAKCYRTRSVANPAIHAMSLEGDNNTRFKGVHSLPQAIVMPEENHLPCGSTGASPVESEPERCTSIVPAAVWQTPTIITSKTRKEGDRSKRKFRALVGLNESWHIRHRRLKGCCRPARVAVMEVDRSFGRHTASALV